MMPEPCRGLPVHPAARPGARAARRGGCCISAGEALKLLARLEDLNVLADEEGQTEQKGLQDLHLRDGLLARGREDAASAGSDRKMDAEAARQKARVRKAETLGAHTS